jgi:hypothetical protein
VGFGSYTSRVIWNEANRIAGFQHELNNLYGSKKNPYYIYSPGWTRSSAGIRALHYLCHSLNSVGETAYLVMTENMHAGEPRVSDLLRTPILTSEIAKSHYLAHLTPIVIYSETVPGNPLHAPFVVRYLMNYVGALGGPERFDKDEFVVAYSENIAIDYRTKSKKDEVLTLFLPAVDPREMQSQETEEKSFSVVYAGKYRSFVGEPSKIESGPTIEIFRDGPKMQSRQEVLSLLANARRVYSFENSSIITEATLSGTPAVLVPSEFFVEAIAEQELGWGGIAWGIDEREIERASRTIDEGVAQYFEAIRTYFLTLEQFIASTQNSVVKIPYLKRVAIPKNYGLVNAHRISLAMQIMQSQGFPTLVRVTKHFAMRRLSWRFWVGKR